MRQFISLTFIGVDVVSAAADQGEVVFESMTIDDNGDFTFVEYPVDVNGQNKVDLPVAAARWMRMKSFGLTQGVISAYRDTAISGGIPTDQSFIHCQIPQGSNQSQKAGTTISKDNYFLLSDIWADMIKKSNAVGDVEFRVREKGGQFRVAPRRGMSIESPYRQEYKAPRIIEPNSDIEIYCSSSATATIITAGFDGIFADIV